MKNYTGLNSRSTVPLISERMRGEGERSVPVIGGGQHVSYYRGGRGRGMGREGGHYLPRTGHYTQAKL